jgi:hypothetical protein
MALVNETYRIYYVADNFQTGLIDVLLTVLLPDNTEAGPFTMTEHPLRPGVYYYDYLPIQNGQYYFEADSVTTPKKFVQIVNIEGFGSVPYAGFDN